MRILFVNAPQPSISGPLISDGHDVASLDCESRPRSVDRLVKAIAWRRPDAVLFDHSGALPAHLASSAAAAMPGAWIVYGGVTSSLWRQILQDELYVDAIVRGHSPVTVRQLMHALETHAPLEAIRGIAFRDGNWVMGTPPLPETTVIGATTPPVQSE